MRNTRFYSRAKSALIILGAGIMLALINCSGPYVSQATEIPTLTPTLQPPVHVTPRHAPITVAVVGDSISAWNGTSPIAHTWTMDLSTGPVVVDYSQGFAHGGYRLAQMAASLQPTHADVLVVLGGTNDVGSKTLNPADTWGTSLVDMQASLTQIVAESGAKTVIIDAIPPLNAQPTAAALWNTTEQQMAIANGWTYFDPWTQLRDPAGGYVPSLTLDGIHPNDVGSQLIANAMRTEIKALVHPAA